ncbi:MAG: cytochrome c, class [Ramlibacter sp.]|nr:cytochrome c, class [Ramlibacter sp.]
MKEIAITSPPTSRRHPVLKTLFVLALVAAALFLVLAWHPEMEPVATPARGSFDTGLLRRGEQLATVGNCASCHTAADGPPYAGGTPLKTPFGTVYGTNITPEPVTGIGAWSEAAFRRALREGVSRDGHLLYPAFPYDHFTRLADDDIAALYSFVMTRDPVRSTPPVNRMAFPLQFRPLVAGWNLLSLDKGPLPVQSAQPAEWNRGAYLAEGLGHCSACHSPRNALGAERRDVAFSGGDAEGWHATALDTHSPSPVPWTPDALAAYLRTGLVADHAITAGPMQDVVHSLSHAPEADVRAIATYIHSLMGSPTPQRQAREAASRRKATQVPLVPIPGSPATDDAQLRLGASVYASSCASCHDAGRQLSSAGALQLPLAIALYVPDPRNLVHIVRQGIQPAPGQPGRWMPPFDGELTDEQITALAVWLRRQVADQPPWPDVAKVVQDTRKPSP